MKPEIVLAHEFVEFIPDELKERTLYVSMQYKTVVHLCGYGCGRQVITPLAPTQWKLTFDGASISLWPSVGSWSLPCQSHYIIEGSRVRWPTVGRRTGSTRGAQPRRGRETSTTGSSRRTRRRARRPGPRFRRNRPQRRDGMGSGNGFGRGCSASHGWRPF